MKKTLAILLRDKSEEVADMFSNPDRMNNQNGETFKVLRICPLSEHTAAVVYLKNTGKRALAYFYCVPSKEYWNYFFVNSGHLSGLCKKVSDIYQEIEEYNFKFNFLEMK